MRKIIMFALISFLLISCIRKVEPKKDDFLASPKIEESKPEERIKIIEGSSFSYFQIVEVDGHQYLANGNHGGFIHLESCPCKKKL